MVSRIRAILSPAAMLALLLLAACSGGGDDGSDSTTPAQPTPTGQAQDSDGGGSNGLSAAAGVLSTSRTSFKEDVQSLQSELKFTISGAGLDVDTTANMTYEAPEQMHITMSINSPGPAPFEVLALDGEVYQKSSATGWQPAISDGFEGSGLGVDNDALQRAIEHHSLMNYEPLFLNVAKTVEDVGEETVDGNTYRRFHSPVDFGVVTFALNDPSSSILSPQLNGVEGPLTLDVWVDPDTLLPHRLTINGEIDLDQGTIAVDISISFSHYDEPVEFPDPTQGPQLPPGFPNPFGDATPTPGSGSSQ